MKLIASLLTMLLAACANVPAIQSSAPSTEVRIPVPVRCVDPADVPPVPGTALKPGMSLDQRVAAMAADLDAYQLYVDRADPLIQKCTTLPKAADGPPLH